MNFIIRPIRLLKIFMSKACWLAGLDSLSVCGVPLLPSLSSASGPPLMQRMMLLRLRAKRAMLTLRWRAALLTSVWP